MASSERTNEAATAAPTPAAASTATPAPAAEAAEAGSRAADQGGSAGQYSPGPATAATPVDGARISCLTNAQYHSGREAFLDTVHRWFMFTVIALGTGALIDLLPKEHIVPGTVLSIGLKEIFAASAAIIAALDLTFDLSNRARMHAMQKRRYFELLAQLNAGEKTPDQVRVCIDQYSADEEPQYRVMIFACWNAAQLTIYGDKAHRFDIPMVAGWFKNWFRRPSAHYDLKASTTS
jgi:hypothetical protein